MSIGFNWFKDYQFYLFDEYYGEYALEYLDGDSTSHSAGNIIKVQDLLEKYGSIRIPSVCRHWDTSDYKLELIEPNKMSDICAKILDDTEVDEVDMRDRIKWFKKLSDDGYYLTYDCNY